MTRAQILKALVVISLVTIVSVPLVQSNASQSNPATVTTTNTNAATQLTSQRKTAFASGLWWVFFTDTGGLYESSSPEGATWSTRTLITSNDDTASDVAVWVVSNVLYYASVNGNNNTYYRFGSLNSDGSITWSIAEGFFTVANAAPSTRAQEPNIVVDNTGQLWISVQSHFGDGGSTHLEIWLCKTPLSCSWTKVNDFAYTPQANLIGILLPISNPSGVALIYNQNAGNNFPLSFISTYNSGVTWTPSVNTTNSYILFTVSAVSVGSVVYVVAGDSTNLVVRFFSYDSENDLLSSEVNLISGISGSRGLPLTTDDNGRFVFLAYSATSTLTYYACIQTCYIPSGWFSNTLSTTDTLLNSFTLGSSLNSKQDVLGALWSTGNGAPNTIRFALVFYPFNPAPIYNPAPPPPSPIQNVIAFVTSLFFNFYAELYIIIGASFGVLAIFAMKKEDEDGSQA